MVGRITVLGTAGWVPRSRGGFAEVGFELTLWDRTVDRAKAVRTLAAVPLPHRPRRWVARRNLSSAASPDPKPSGPNLDPQGRWRGRMASSSSR